MIDVIHAVCGGVAFRLRCTIEEAREGVVLDSRMLAYDDGRVLVDDDGTAVVGSLIVCQACNEGIGPLVFDGDRLIATDGEVSMR